MPEPILKPPGADTSLGQNAFHMTDSLTQLRQRVPYPKYYGWFHHMMNLCATLGLTFIGIASGCVVKSMNRICISCFGLWSLLGFGCVAQGIPVISNRKPAAYTVVGPRIEGMLCLSTLEFDPLSPWFERWEWGGRPRNDVGRALKRALDRTNPRADGLLDVEIEEFDEPFQRCVRVTGTPVRLIKPF